MSTEIETKIEDLSVSELKELLSNRNLYSPETVALAENSLNHAEEQIHALILFFWMRIYTGNSCVSFADYKKQAFLPLACLTIFNLCSYWKMLRFGWDWWTPTSSSLVIIAAIAVLLGSALILIQYYIKRKEV